MRSVFLAVFIPLAFLSHRISQGVKNSPIGPLDRAAGVGFGILRGLVIVGLAYLAFTYFIPIREHPRWLADAELLPMVQNTSEVLLSVVPDQPTDFAFIPSHRERLRKPKSEPNRRGAPPTSSHDPIAELIRANGDANRVSKTTREPVQQKSAGTAQKSYGANDRKALDTLDRDRRKRRPMTGQSDHIWDDDALHEECGVFGIFDHAGRGALAVLGLHSLQHRGQEAAGIVTYDNGHFIAERHMGLVGDAFGTQLAGARNLKGRFAIGHNRYSTAGGSRASNIQPMFADLAGGGLAIAHNGNLTNAHTLRTELVGQGAIFHSTSDTETIIHLTARSTKARIVDKLIDALHQVEGAYSLVALTSKKLIGVRDPNGVRPLVMGQLDGAYIFASETCALDIIGAEYVRDVKPGEMVVVDKDGRPDPVPLQAAGAPLLRLRIHLFRASRLHPGRAQRLRSAQEYRRGAGPWNRRSRPTW